MSDNGATILSLAATSRFYLMEQIEKLDRIGTPGTRAFVPTKLTSKATHRVALFVWLMLFLNLGFTAESTLLIFDAHIHYNQDVWESLPPAHALHVLNQAGLSKALVSSTPTDGTERLYRLAPKRIVPLLRPYPTSAHRYTWFRDPAILPYVRDHLARIPYRGIGEFHVFGDGAASMVMGEIISLARQRRLALHAHTDLVGLKAILQRAPDISVIWAHSGFDVPVLTLRSLLQQHPHLYLELSFREGITDNGQLTPEWQVLMTEHQHRFLLGMDTYTPSRWAELPELATDARWWLTQLPRPVAEAIAYGNAARIFALE